MKVIKHSKNQINNTNISKKKKYYIPLKKYTTDLQLNLIN